MILDLLSFLNIKEVQAKATQPIQILFFVHLLILNFFSLQTHVSTNSSNMRSSPHVVIHLVKSVRVGSKAHIQQNRIFWFELIADAIEEPIVRGQLSTVFVLDTKNKIDIF